MAATYIHTYNNTMTTIKPFVAYQKSKKLEGHTFDHNHVCWIISRERINKGIHKKAESWRITLKTNFIANLKWLLKTNLTSN